MPAAAVIPAPIAYMKVVAVKKLVVGFLILLLLVRPLCCVLVVGSSFRCPPLAFTGSMVCLRIFYFEKIRVFKAGISL